MKKTFLTSISTMMLVLSLFSIGCWGSKSPEPDKNQSPQVILQQEAPVAEKQIPETGPNGQILVD